jgi:hypothetical protein
MSRRIYLDVEESLSREVRRITFFNQRTLSEVVLQDTFDPITGDTITMPVEPNFYDSGADTNNIQYPHFFIRLLKTREDRFTGRVVPEYGRWITTPVLSSPKAFDIIVSSTDGIVTAPGNEFNTSLFQIRKIVPGNLLRLLNGNNIGTYIVSSITVSNSGDHSIFVSNTLLNSLPSALFDSTPRNLIFSSPVDLNTLKVGDIFTDAAATTFSITAISINNNSISLNGSFTPNLASGGFITRSGNVFTATDVSLVRFLVLDQTKPITALLPASSAPATSSFTGVSPQVPVDAYYLIRIDSKERDTHIAIVNRMWEEFNPPRTGLPVIVRSALSAESLLTVDVGMGGSNTLTITDNTNFNIGDEIFIFDNLSPTIDLSTGGLERPFQTIITNKISNNQIVVANTVPDSFIVDNNTNIVSNADFEILMFHFVDHNTRDLEGSQYWIHEFTFWVQIWIDRLENPQVNSTIRDISTPIEDLQGNIIIDDP